MVVEREVRGSQGVGLILNPVDKQYIGKYDFGNVRNGKGTNENSYM